jgi:hypothetical protein
LATPEGAVADPTFFTMTHDVWRRTDEDGSGPCPSMFPFETVLPDVFSDNGHRRPLPPTYDNPTSAATDIGAQCRYLLRVIVERKGSKLAIWKLPKK